LKAASLTAEEYAEAYYTGGVFIAVRRPFKGQFSQTVYDNAPL
jgi:hypothetical protein